MSAAEETIARVLREHAAGIYIAGIRCSCGNWGPYSSDFRSHAEHAAAALSDALGLREETKLLDDGMGSIMTAPDGTVTSRFRPQTRMRRFVSPWLPEAQP